MRNENLGMKKEKRIFMSLLIVACSLLIVLGCKNSFSPPINSNDTNGVLVSIYIGAQPSARTIQPGEAAIAGYQLSFAGGIHAPVNISDTNRADVYLENGTWIITARAYRLGSEIGNILDAIASGSINITITNGVVTSGPVSPIILGAIGTGDGTLHYDINFESGVSGTLTLWQIDGLTTVGSFGSSGVLSLASPDSGNATLPAGRYIAEARLTRTDSFIAFRREVVEIWPETISAFIFTPTVYLDPNRAEVANSQAVLSETGSTINGNAIGSGTGSGSSELDPKIYDFILVDRENIPFELVFEADSLFSTLNWSANDGSLPDGVYPNNGPLPTDYSTDSTLWVRVVSEDGSETMYYRFSVMLPLADFGDFTVTSSNVSGISWDSPNLTITQSGIYHITGTGLATTDRIRVTGSNITANIVLKDVNINVRDTASATAFDITGSATVNLTILGYNILSSGSDMAGLAVPLNSSLLITAASTGSLIAASGTGGRGIGGWGTVSIAGGTVTATGGSSDGFVGGASGISCREVNITGGTVTAIGGGGVSGGSGGNSIHGGTGISHDGSSGKVSITGGSVTSTGGLGGSNGNGGRGIGGTVSITGGSVIATGGNGRGGGSGGAGIGGTISITGGSVTATGGSSGNGLVIANGINASTLKNALVFASSIWPTLIEGDNVNDSIVFIGYYGTVYGNAILGQDLTIPSGGLLTIPSGRSLTIPGYVTLLNNGTIRLYGIVNGIVSGNQPIPPELPISGDMLFSYTGEVLTITGDGTYTISMRSGLSSTTQGGIVVAPGVNANITLSGVNIDASATSNASAFDITGATVNLTLVGESILKSGSGMAGFTTPIGSSLVITEVSTGSLTVTGGTNGAGIGSNNSGNSGMISIQGGTVTATGGASGAGIGGGSSGSGGTASITGGIVTVTGGINGAGIGGGANGSGGTVNIAGGSIIVTGGTNGAGIGGGANGTGGTVSITGGIVTATGGTDAIGIGRGSGFGSAGTLSVNNNAVVFANSIQPVLTEGINANDSIVFIGNNGTLYGDFTLKNSVSFDVGRILTIPAGRSLTIPGAVILTNNGTINNSGTITGRENITGSGSINDL